MNFLIKLRSINELIARTRTITRVSSCIRRNANRQMCIGRLSTGRGMLPFEMNTAVPKDILLFKYENDRFFRNLNFFALSQFVFWVYLSEFAYSTLKDVSKEEAERLIRASLPPEVSANQKLAWWRRINLGENKYRNGITLLCFSLGCGILAAITMVSRRTVKYLRLLKGGKEVQLQCYSPWWLPSRTITTSVDNFSCQAARSHVNVSLPINIKGYRLYFLLDKSGVFTNTKLFDLTAGLKRTWR